MTSKMIWTPLAAVLLVAQAALAQTPSSGVTREQVKKECAEARKAGKIQDGECQPDAPYAKGASTQTRAEVRKEATEARRGWKIEDGECKYDLPEKIKSTRTRAEVQAECAAARKAGKIQDGEGRP